MPFLLKSRLSQLFFQDKLNMWECVCPSTAGLWEEHAYDVRLVGRVSLKHNRAVSYSPFLSLRTRRKGMCVCFPLPD